MNPYQYRAYARQRLISWQRLAVRNNKGLAWSAAWTAAYLVVAAALALATALPF